MDIFPKVGRKFWPKGWQPNIWAVFDASRDPKLFTRIHYSGLVRECLFAGDLPPELQQTAPYLVQLEHDDKRSIELIEEGWDKSWCIYLEADVGLKTLRKHLRTLLRVQDPQGNYMLFRYYDPRVLRVYLPTCVPEELERVYGPIKRIWTEEGRGSSRMLQFERKGGSLDRSAFEVL